MVTIHVPGWGLGLEGLSTVGADVQVGVWPAQQQAGQGTPQRMVVVLRLTTCLQTPHDVGSADRKSGTECAHSAAHDSRGVGRESMEAQSKTTWCYESSD